MEENFLSIHEKVGMMVQIQQILLLTHIPYVPLSLGQLVGVITPIIRPDIDPQSFFLDNYEH